MAVSCPDCARHATKSRPKYFIRCTSPTLISSDQATWNQPVGVIDRGGLAINRNHRAFNVNGEPLPNSRRNGIPAPKVRVDGCWNSVSRERLGVSIPVQVG